MYATAPHDRTATAGPAVTFTALIPDLHHYHGRGGRAFPLYRDAGGNILPNVPAALLEHLAEVYGRPVTAADVMAYIAAVAAHPNYTERFAADLAQPGLRIPLTSESALFREAVEVGKRVIWLHTFGERFADAAAGRPPAPPRLPAGEAPRVPADGTIPSDPGQMPEEMRYDADARRLHVGAGRPG